MFWKYNKEIKKEEKIVVGILLCIWTFALLSQKVLSTHQYETLQKLSILFSKYNSIDLLPIGLISKLPQLYHCYKIKSTGQLSFLSFLLSFLGTIGRLATIIVEKSDFLYKLGYMVTFCLGIASFIQFGLYHENT